MTPTSMLPHFPDISPKIFAVSKGGQKTVKPDLPDKTTRTDRPSVIPQAIFRRIWIRILLFFGFSDGYQILHILSGGYSTRPTN